MTQHAGLRDGHQGKRLFFETNKQKTFGSAAAPNPSVLSARTTVFWFFFQKRTAFACLLFCHPCLASPRTEAAARLARSQQEHAADAQAQATARRDLSHAEAQAGRLADALAAQAAGVRRLDAEVSKAEAELAHARQDRQVADAELARAQAGFTALLPAMLRLSDAPIGAVLAASSEPALAAQGLLITRGLAEGFDAQAAALRTEQDRAAAAAVQAQFLASRLAAARAAQAARAAELNRAVAQAGDQVSEAEQAGREAAAAVARTAGQAATLHEAIAAMDTAAAQARAGAAREAAEAARMHRDGQAGAARAREAALTRPGGAALSRSDKTLQAPVAGPILRAFGAPAADGPAAGLTFAAAAGAMVASPCAGRVAFAAPFRSYGQLVILECGGGYDLVLAGLGSIGAAPGQRLRPGQPLGRMGAAEHDGLYVELRTNGRPVDPAPFLKPQL